MRSKAWQQGFNAAWKIVGETARRLRVEIDRIEIPDLPRDYDRDQLEAHNIAMEKQEYRRAQLTGVNKVTAEMHRAWKRATKIARKGK